jgi:UDP-N-acetyl-D-glucosamine dehydrogenase
MELREKIESKKSNVVIVGLGYVGLPLALKFAEAGFSVTGIDMQAEKVNKVNRGRSFIDDVDSKHLSKAVSGGRLKAVSDFSAVRKADAVIICVPTPLTINKTPDISYVENVTRELKKYLHKDMHNTGEHHLPRDHGGGFETHS